MKEKRQSYCRACRATIAHDPPSSTTSFVLCRYCAAAVSFSQRQREVVRIVASDVSHGKIQLIHDSQGNGWAVALPPKPAPQGTPIVMDNGEPRYADWQPHRIVSNEQLGGGSDGE